MKRINIALLLSMIGAFALTGCVSHRQAMAPTSRVIIVKETPPPGREEVQTVAPGPTHTWVAGYWAYTSNRWVWVTGHWEQRPRTEAIWQPGHWDKDELGRGWVWTPGHWE